MRYALTETISGLLGVDIKERGVNALLLCPFHQESTPSFSIHLNDGLWQCFGCGERGGLKKLHRKLGEEMSRDLYHDMLINSLRLDVESRRDFSSLAKSQRSALNSSRAISALQKYISSKPISEDAIFHFGMGWSREKTAISIPYYDDGLVGGIKYRLSDGRKIAETGSTFAGIYNVDDVRGKKYVVLCEGESDTHAMWSLLRGREDTGVGGISGGVHDSGSWALWAVDLMYAKTVYIAFDADDVGDRGHLAAAAVLGQEKCVRIRPTHGKDVCDHIMNGGSFAELGLEG